MLVACRTCKKTFDVPATNSQITAWHHGVVIQEAMPHLTSAERELLISRTCGVCWDKMFPEED